MVAEQILADHVSIVRPCFLDGLQVVVALLLTLDEARKAVFFEDL